MTELIIAVALILIVFKFLTGATASANQQRPLTQAGIAAGAAAGADASSVDAYGPTLVDQNGQPLSTPVDWAASYDPSTDPNAYGIETPLAPARPNGGS